MPDASPAKWQVAHTTWFFETLVLSEYVEDHRSFETEFRKLFNSQACDASVHGTQCIA